MAEMTENPMIYFGLSESGKRYCVHDLALKAKLIEVDRQLTDP